MEAEFTSIWRALDCSYDDFIRTTQPRHRAAVQKMAQACYDAGDIYDGVYEGWYCVSCEAFKPEKDLVDGKCPLHPTLTPEWIREKNYFFRLSKYRDRLLQHFEAHPGFLEPEIRRNEILRLLDGGLEDISVSRAGQSWGIPLPFAPDKVVYVWFDALINYATAVGYGTDDARLAQWWPADLHVIGKDITRFHTVVWPAMLWSAGLEAPRQVFGHGWLHYGGQRMSKSLGTSVDPVEAASRFGKDAIRLYLTKEISYGSDGDFTWERFEERYNVDLANNFGNLVSRVVSMADKYRGGRIAPAGDGGRLAEVAGNALARYTQGDGRTGPARGRRRRVPDRRCRQRLHRRQRAVEAGQGPGQRPAPRRRVVRSRRSRARGRGAAAARDAVVVRGNSAPHRRARQRARRFGSTTPAGSRPGSAPRCRARRCGPVPNRRPRRRRSL